MPPWPRINILLSRFSLECGMWIILYDYYIELGAQQNCGTNRVTHEVFAECGKICEMRDNHAKCVTGGNPSRNSGHLRIPIPDPQRLDPRIFDCIGPDSVAQGAGIGSTKPRGHHRCKDHQGSHPAKDETGAPVFAAADARKADGASRPTLRIPRPPSLTGRLAWTQQRSVMQMFANRLKPALRL